MPMLIEIDDPARPDVYALLEEHLRHMHELSPPESVHALDVSRLKSPDITFWSVREGDQLLGCGALKQLSPTHGEIKSMRTPAARRNPSTRPTGSMKALALYPPVRLATTSPTPTVCS